MEIVGISNRGNNDFKNLEKNFKNLKKKIHKNIEELNLVEFSFGIERILRCIIKENLKEINSRLSLVLKPKISPYLFSINPLIDDSRLEYFSKKLFKNLKENYKGIYMDNNSIGKRYSYCDYNGIPYSITIDFESLEDDCVTIRNIINKEKKRINKEEIKEYFFNSLKENKILL